MSEKLSEENRALVERLESHLGISPQTADYLIEHWGQANTLLNAARAEARPVTGMERGGLIDPKRIREVVAEGDGFWRTCSGCHEAEDGHDVGHYPFSPEMGCTLGGGCGECGGLGAIWDGTDYTGFGDAPEEALLSPAVDREAVARVPVLRSTPPLFTDEDRAQIEQEIAGCTPMDGLLSEDGVRRLLMNLIGERSQSAWARENGITPQQISHFLNGNRHLEPKIAAALGLSAVTLYRSDGATPQEDAILALLSPAVRRDGEPSEDFIRLVAEAMGARTGYSISLTRLVDGVETYTLSMDGYEPQDFDDRDEAAEVLHQRLNRDRAKRLFALLSPSPGEGAP